MIGLPGIEIEIPIGCGKPIAGHGVRITEYGTGRELSTVTSADLTIRIYPEMSVRARLTMFVNKDGEPVYDGPPVIGSDGLPSVGGFVAEVYSIRTVP